MAALTSGPSAEISVIIPCYNHGHFLSCALDSVLAQSFVRWEAIVVDDGSTDDTADVARRYNDRRIRYVHQQNAGLPAARNRGIEEASGRYLAFLDADDEWESDFLAVCRQALESERGIAGVFTRCRYIDQAGSLLPGTGGQALEPGEFRARLLQGGFFPPNAIMVRTSIVKASAWFDTSLTSVEDWDLWLRISGQHDMRGIEPALARYRVYPGSMSTNTKRMHDNRMAVLAKQFGEPVGEPDGWSEEKRRAFGYAYLTAAYGYLRQGDDDVAWRFMHDASALWPPLLAELDTYYELVCRDQPRGYRGMVSQLDIAVNAGEMFERMEAMLDGAPPALSSRRKEALAQANLAVAMLYDQAGQWNQARKHMICALRSRSALMLDPGFRRRFVKVTFLHPRLVEALHKSRRMADKG